MAGVVAGVIVLVTTLKLGTLFQQLPKVHLINPSQVCGPKYITLYMYVYVYVCACACLCVHTGSAGCHRVCESKRHVQAVRRHCDAVAEKQD